MFAKCCIFKRVSVTFLMLSISTPLTLLCTVPCLTKPNGQFNMIMFIATLTLKAYTANYCYRIATHAIL